METRKRFYFNWVLSTLFRPKKTLIEIAAQSGNTWLTPMLLLSVTALILALVSGWIQGLTAVAPELSPDFQYLSPDQQAQLMQSLQMRQGPVFRYVFPAVTALLGVWVGWLLVGGLLHLLMTLQGGRGNTAAAMNLVAWANLPLAVRDIVQILYLSFARQPIASPGLSGFVNTEAGGWSLVLSLVVALVDIYLIWRLVLLVIGVQAANGLSFGKALTSALLSLVIVMLLQVGLSYLGTTLSNLSVIRMFF